MIGALILNGDKYNGEIVGDYVVCCDGGYDKVSHCDYFIGDMDSVTACVTCPILPLERMKNMTDGEVGIDFLVKKGVDKIIIYGLDGGRFDHQVMNISLMARAVSSGIPCEARCNSFTAYMAHGDFFGDFERGAILSMVPFDDDAHILYTKGLDYPLVDYSMSKFSSRTISNVVSTGRVEIALSGYVLIIVNQEKEAVI